MAQFSNTESVKINSLPSVAAEFHQKVDFGLFKVFVFLPKMVGFWDYEKHNCEKDKPCANKIKAYYVLTPAVLPFAMWNLIVTSVFIFFTVDEMLPIIHSHLRVNLLRTFLFIVYVSFYRLLCFVSYVHCVMNRADIAELLIETAKISSRIRKRILKDSIVVILATTVTMLAFICLNFRFLYVGDSVMIWNYKITKGSDTVAFYGTGIIKETIETFIDIFVYMYLLLYAMLVSHFGSHMAKLYTSVTKMSKIEIINKEMLIPSISRYVRVCSLVHHTNIVFSGMAFVWYGYFMTFFLVMIPYHMIVKRDNVILSVLNSTLMFMQVFYFCILTTMASKAPDTSGNVRERFRQIIHKRVLSGSDAVEYLSETSTLTTIFTTNDYLRASHFFQIRKPHILGVATAIAFYMVIIIGITK